MVILAWIRSYYFRNDMRLRVKMYTLRLYDTIINVSGIIVALVFIVYESPDDVVLIWYSFIVLQIVSMAINTICVIGFVYICMDWLLSLVVLVFMGPCFLLRYGSIDGIRDAIDSIDDENTDTIDSIDSVSNYNASDSYNT